MNLVSRRRGEAISQAVLAVVVAFFVILLIDGATVGGTVLASDHPAQNLSTSERSLEASSKKPDASASPPSDVSAQPSDRLLSVAGMQEDLDEVERRALAAHPALADPERAAAFRRVVDEARTKARTPLRYAEFAFLVNEVLATLHDAHTSVFFPQDYHCRRLPLQLRWAADGIVVTNVTNVKDAPPPPPEDIAQPGGNNQVNQDQDQVQFAPPHLPAVGDQILTIGGMTPNQLLGRLEQFVPADNVYWVRFWALADPFGLTAEPMLRHLGLVAPDGTVAITVQTGAGEVKQYAVPLVAGIEPTHFGTSRPVVGWYLDAAHSLGVLYARQMLSPPGYGELIDQFFAAVKANGIQRIVLDLRDNMGGFPAIEDVVLQHLPALKRGYTFRPRGAEHGRKDTVLFTPLDDQTYRGKVYVLVSGGTASAATVFATLLRDNGAATIVGEPGAPPSFAAGGWPLRLPVSGLWMAVSCGEFQRPDSSRDPADALEPDVYIPTTVADVRAGRDPQIEWVKNDTGAGRGAPSDGAAH